MLECTSNSKRVQKDSHRKLSIKKIPFYPITDLYFNQEPIRLQQGPLRIHIQKSVIVQLYRSVGDDSKIKLSHSIEKPAQLLEMLQSSKDANETMRSIQNIIMGSKRDKKIDHPKTILTLDLDEQKQTVRKTRKIRAKIYLRHGEGYKTKLQNFKSLTKQTPKRKRSKVYKNYPRT